MKHESKYYIGPSLATTHLQHDGGWFLNLFVVVEVCVTAAREDNTAEINRLQSELKTVVDYIQSMEENQQLLEQENAALM